MPVRKTHGGGAGFAERAVAFGQRHFVLASLVAVDVATKQLAFRLLPAGATAEGDTGFGFHLTLNEWGVLGGVQGVAAVTANSVYTLLLAAALLGLALMVRWLSATGMSFAARLLVGSVLFVIVANLVQFVARPFAYVTLPPDLVINSIRASALVMSLTLYSVSRSAMGCAVFTLLSAGSLANGLSYVYPPFEVIDFLRVPVPGFQGAFGVINLADVYIVAAILAALAWPPVALIAWGRQWWQRRSRARRTRSGRIRSEAAAVDAAD